MCEWVPWIATNLLSIRYTFSQPNCSTLSSEYLAIKALQRNWQNRSPETNQFSFNYFIFTFIEKKNIAFLNKNILMADITNETAYIYHRLICHFAIATNRAVMWSTMTNQPQPSQPKMIFFSGWNCWAPWFKKLYTGWHSRVFAASAHQPFKWP